MIFFLFISLVSTLAISQSKIEFNLLFDTVTIGTINHGRAISNNMETKINPKSISFLVSPSFDGGVALWTSDITEISNTTWTEAGNITFGESGNSIVFRTMGVGYQLNGPNNSYGGMLCEIFNGTGNYEGAKGFMTNSFISLPSESDFYHSWMGIFLDIKSGESANH